MRLFEEQAVLVPSPSLETKASELNEILDQGLKERVDIL
jgi:hypothetical protein